MPRTYVRVPISERFWAKVEKTVLSAKQVLDIRARVSAGHRQIELAREYDVSKTTICSIISRRSWSHL